MAFIDCIICTCIEMKLTCMAFIHCINMAFIDCINMAFIDCITCTKH